MSATSNLLTRVRVRLVLRSAIEDLQIGLAAGAGVGLATMAAQRMAKP